MHKIRVGVVGAGAMGQHHVRVYSELQASGLKTSPDSEIELAGIADSDPDQAAKISRRHHVPYYTDYHDLLGKVEAVSIAVPTTLHQSIASDFLKAGVHCLVEKPIAGDPSEAAQMIVEAAQNRVNLAVGHIEHFNPAVRKLKQIIDKGLLGQITSISTKRVGPREPRIKDVGIVIDSLTHDIGVIRYLLHQDPACISAKVGSLSHPKGDNALVLLDFSGIPACLEANWLTPIKVRTLIATGSKGIVHLDYIEQRLTLYNTQNQASEVPVIKEEPLKLEIEDFLINIIEGHPPSVNGEEGQAILKSAFEIEKRSRDFKS